ncbi:MAG: hypothetical protein RLZZ65_101 [Bacteroidota bacterium]|jgi:hypothetical protein
MSFWNTFVKVWQVRKSIQIQESLEGWFHARRNQKHLEDNLEEIANEVVQKNFKWNEELERKRKS